MACVVNYRVGNTVRLTILLGLLLVGVSPTFAGDDRAGAAAPPSVEIKELGAAVVASSDGLRVTRVTPAAERPDKYRDVDIKKGDRIVSINGQRVSTLNEFRKIMETLKVGDQVRLGSLRSGGAAVAVYTVGSDDDLKVVTVSAAKVDGGGCTMMQVGGKPSTEGGTGERKMMTIKAGPDSAPLIELSAIIEDIDGQVVVSQILPVPSDVPDEARLHEKDVIKSIQGRKLAKARDLMEQFRAIADGDEVTLEIVRDGKDERLSFAKPKMQGSVMYKTK